MKLEGHSEINRIVLGYIKLILPKASCLKTFVFFVLYVEIPCYVLFDVPLPFRGLRTTRPSVLRFTINVNATLYKSYGVAPTLM